VIFDKNHLINFASVIESLNKIGIKPAIIKLWCKYGPYLTYQVMDRIGEILVKFLAILICVIYVSYQVHVAAALMCEIFCHNL
jgi:hypothetical protein